MDGTIIIYYFGGSNNIFADCITIRVNTEYSSTRLYRIRTSCINKDENVRRYAVREGKDYTISFVNS